MTRPLDEEMVYLPEDARRQQLKIKTVYDRLGLPWLGTLLGFLSTPANCRAILNQYGVGKYFSDRELFTPGDKKKAKRVGYDLLVPPSHTWPVLGLLLYLADGCRRTLGRPVTLKSLWRPQSYNAQVAKSGIRSDHPNCKGMDLVFKSTGDRRKAEGFIRGFAAAFPMLGISMGMGWRRLHVGIMVRRRSWFYKWYPDKKVKL